MADTTHMKQNRVQSMLQSIRSQTSADGRTMMTHIMHRTAEAKSMGSFFARSETLPTTSAI